MATRPANGRGEISQPRNCRATPLRLCAQRFPRPMGDPHNAMARLRPLTSFLRRLFDGSQDPTRYFAVRAPMCWTHAVSRNATPHQPLPNAPHFAGSRDKPQTLAEIQVLWIQRRYRMVSGGRDFRFAGSGCPKRRARGQPSPRHVRVPRYGTVFDALCERAIEPHLSSWPGTVAPGKNRLHFGP